MKFLFSPHAGLFSLLWMFPALVFCQSPEKTGIATGRITERITGQPVINARVIIEPQSEISTDSDGRWRIELPPGTYTGKIVASGYAPQSIAVITITARYTSVYDAKLDVQVSDETTISSGWFAQTTDQTVSAVTLRRNEIRAIPGTGGDVLRVISSLPGVTSVSSQFADLLVRGGQPGENLTFIDNIPVGDFTYFTDQYDSGLGGRAAVLAPDVFDRLEFSAGGFGSRYGDRLSSALDVTLRNASRDRVQGSIFADSGVAGLSLEIPLGKRGGWFASVRRSYIDFALELFNIGDIGKPRNLDFVNKFDVDLSSRHRLSLTAMNFNERVTIPLETAQRAAARRDQLIAERSGRRLIIGATLTSTLGERTLSNVTAWGSAQHDDGSFLRLNNTTLQRQRDLRSSQFGIKEELTTSLSPRLNLSAGGGVMADQGRFFTFERSPAGFSLIGEEYRAPTRSHTFRLTSTTSAYGYAQLAWQISSRLSITPGIRVDRYGLTSQTQASPRLSAKLRMLPQLSLNLATGIYRQPPSNFVMALAPQNRQLQTQRALHFIGGIEWQPVEDIRFTLEAYQKNYDDLIVQPSRTSPIHFNTGQARVRGVEIAAQKALSGRFSWQAAYAYTNAEKRFARGDLYFPSESARPHQFTIIGLTQFAGFSIASKLRTASGLAYSNLVLVPPRGSASPLPNLYELTRPENRNALRFPGFVQLDLRVERRFNYRRWSFAPYADIFNLTKHRNVTDVTWRTLFGPNFLSERKLIPIIGARIEF
jgi:outer membrane receptor protein involved in Fe transport